MIKKFIALIFSIIVVHMIYIGYVRPEANALIEVAKAEGLTTPREIVVILKDYEQEICFILLLWGCFLITNSYREILKTKYLFSVDLIEDTDTEKDDDTDKDTDTENDKTRDRNKLDVDSIIEKLDKQIPKDNQKRTEFI
jgi:hypothetical protein